MKSSPKSFQRRAKRRESNIPRTTLWGEAKKAVLDVAVEKSSGLWPNVTADLIRLNDRSSDKIISNQPNFSRPTVIGRSLEKS